MLLASPRASRLAPAQSDYRVYIEARKSLGIQGATWMDLMMWSVLAGHFELSRVIWLHSNEPLRAALMAARATAWLRSQVYSEQLAEGLEKAAAQYELWACGILDQIEHSADAFDLLTCTPARRSFSAADRGSTWRPTLSFGEDSKEWISLWSSSVLDEAARSPYPCRKFLAHRHCQYVLEQFFCGHYRGSAASIPPSTDVIG